MKPVLLTLKTAHESTTVAVPDSNPSEENGPADSQGPTAWLCKPGDDRCTRDPASTEGGKLRIQTLNVMYLASNTRSDGARLAQCFLIGRINETRELFVARF
ncbi:hypothetical protein HIM_12070 [Hirsutella minnesotensis 3608]|uniref:Uncharacterized protein n=1 Tax=Hirsutella minnesotensis 3608 TaxID=1043627 RepID=A0A0F7ZW87_9HYPO|nr:hypothetical protein HIM_12070 [Hirsutella minnesotensis 3608]